MRCRSPPESRKPRSPTTVSKPSGRSRTNADRTGGRDGAIEILVARGRPRQAEVLGDRLVEQERVLRDEPDHPPELPGIELADVVAADPNGALLRVGEPQEQGGERGLAGAGGPHDRHRLARRDREAHPSIAGASPGR